MGAISYADRDLAAHSVGRCQRGVWLARPRARDKGVRATGLAFGVAGGLAEVGYEEADTVG